jgi:hypothetical protein
MPQEKNTPPRVSIKTRLTAERINGYWKELGYSKEYWLQECSAALRYELVLDYLLNLERQNREALDSIEE